MSEELPDQVIGIRINDKLCADDYEKLLIPLANQKLENHHKLDLLCCVEGEWKAMEPGAVWQDLRLRLGTATGRAWRSSATITQRRGTGCEHDRARITTKPDSDVGILVLEPVTDRALSEDDFEAVSKTIDDYLKEHDRLRGSLIHSRQFPGWQSIGASFPHLKFANTLHDKIGKVVLVTNSAMGAFADHILDPLMLAKIRKFDCEQRNEAMSWLQD